MRKLERMPPQQSPAARPAEKAGGDVYDELDCHAGLCLYDANGNRYKLTVDADGTLSAVSAN